MPFFTCAVNKIVFSIRLCGRSRKVQKNGRFYKNFQINSRFDKFLKNIFVFVFPAPLLSRVTGDAQKIYILKKNN